MGKGALEWGREKRSRLARQIKKKFEYIPVCPKVEVGIGLPREPVQLIGSKDKMKKIQGV